MHVQYGEEGPVELLSMSGRLPSALYEYFDYFTLQLLVDLGIGYNV